MTSNVLRRVIRLLAMMFALTLVAAACGSDDTGETADSTTTTAADAGTDGGDDGADDSALPDLGGRNVTVGVENAYLPFNYIPVGGDEGEGWDYDAWNEICRLLNCTAEFVAAGWPDVIDQVAQGELDTAADGISITDERKEIVDYSDSYMTVQQKFIVGLDDDRYASADDIIDGDAIVATQVGTTNFELAESLLGGTDRIQAYDQFGLAVQALITGDVDAVIIDDAAGVGYIGENADQVKTIDDGLQSDPLGFIYPQGSDLIDPVNAAIAEMKTSGFFEEIGRKFFGTEFTVTYDDIADVVLPGDDGADDSALPDL
ncbi:MAG: substrate-binding periplasmic protein, partial [Acidimicrobiales bacterium]